MSDLVVSEAYFALRYHYGVPGDPRNSALDALFESGDVAPTGCAPEVLATPGLAAAKPSFVDRMIRWGIRVNSTRCSLSRRPRANLRAHARSNFNSSLTYRLMYLLKVPHNVAAPVASLW